MYCKYTYTDTYIDASIFHFVVVVVVDVVVVVKQRLVLENEARNLPSNWAYNWAFNFLMLLGLETGVQWVGLVL